MSFCGGNSRCWNGLSSRSSHDLSFLMMTANSRSIALSTGFRSDSGSGLSVGCGPTPQHSMTVEAVSKMGFYSMNLEQQIQRLRGSLIRCSG